MWPSFDAIDRHLEGRERQLLERISSGPNGSLNDVDERQAAPQGDRLARRALDEQALEAADVELPLAETQLVAATA